MYRNNILIIAPVLLNHQEVMNVRLFKIKTEPFFSQNEQGKCLIKKIQESLRKNHFRTK